MSEIDYSDKTRFARGVAIIYAEQPDAEVRAGDEEIIFGSTDDCSADMRATLRSLGWHGGGESWQFFT